jgi:hypothetical protein
VNCPALSVLNIKKTPLIAIRIYTIILIFLGTITLIFSFVSVAVCQLDWLWFLRMRFFFISALLSSWVATFLKRITPKS